MFPRFFVYETEEGACSKELFGDMLERTERRVDDVMKPNSECVFRLTL